MHASAFPRTRSRISGFYTNRQLSCSWLGSSVISGVMFRKVHPNSLVLQSVFAQCVFVFLVLEDQVKALVWDMGACVVWWSLMCRMCRGAVGFLFLFFMSFHHHFTDVVYLQDMRKFGGPNKIRQKCRLRQCQNFVSVRM